MSVPTDDTPPVTCLDNIILQEHEVKDILQITNVNKASGPDGISPRLLKIASDILAKPLCYIYNLNLTKMFYPLAWKLANVIPVFKKDERNYIESKIERKEKNEDVLQQILVQLDLIQYYPGKLNVEDVFKVNLSNGLKNFSDIKCETEVSKSELVNRVIKSRVLMESFYHRTCILGNNSRSISNGLIEFLLFLPSGKDGDAFDDILFLNLRGNAIDQTKQVFLMNEISSCTVIFMNIKLLQNETNARFLKKMHQTLGSSVSEIMYIIESNDCTREEYNTLTEVLDDIKKVSKRHTEIVDITDDNSKTTNLSDVTEYIQNYLSVELSKGKSTTLEEIEKIILKHDIKTNQGDDVFMNAKTKAQDIFHHLKSQKAPLTNLWKQYSVLLKELNKERKVHQENWKLKIK
ncbi:unnamed protein product [Mytilus coruscus]|uniref:Up-regulator of cell proliferation-like domain-containing protein n=1 Tax=Mytilus coruscus TaxID=42192 RepID=A0A6J8BDL8_MYTCO|nr:unnamed protein product [Mytilus coruscus]